MNESSFSLLSHSNYTRRTRIVWHPTAAPYHSHLANQNIAGFWVPLISRFNCCKILLMVYYDIWQHLEKFHSSTYSPILYTTSQIICTDSRNSVKSRSQRSFFIPSSYYSSTLKYFSFYLPDNFPNAQKERFLLFPLTFLLSTISSALQPFSSFNLEPSMIHCP